MVITSFIAVLPKQTERCYPGSDAFARIGGSNWHNISPLGVRQQEMERFSVPVKQMRVGGYIRPMYAPPERTAKLRTLGKHVHPPDKTPVNGTIMRVVGVAEAEDNGKKYPPNKQDNPHVPDTGGGGFNPPENEPPLAEIT